MIATFEKYMEGQTGLSPEAIREVSSLAIVRKLRRNEPILTAGDVCKHKVFIAAGLLRSFSISSDGQEHILQFSPEATWTLDVESYDRQTPSEVSITAIEPSEVLLWHKQDFNALLLRYPEMKQFSEQMIARSTHYNRRRMISMLANTPEQKYDDFVETFPSLVSRIPLRMIAGYLGISIKTLTRIRHAQLQR